MANQYKPRVLLIGAGSMGTVVGYILNLAGAEVTFLVRPHRAKQLDRPQLLYCYDDRELKEFKDFSYITDAAQMIEGKYDFLIVTLDGAALQNETGQDLVRRIGETVRGTNTNVILGSVFINLLSWFLEKSGLTADQVTNGPLLIHAYPTTAAELVQAAHKDRDLIAKADQVYTDAVGVGMHVGDSAPAVASAFAELYNASKVSRCAVLPAAQLAVFMDSFFPALLVFDLLGWPKIKDLNTEDELWKLATKGVREIQGLSIHGEAGQAAASATTSASLASTLLDFENKMGAFDFQAFNRFHHGGKVNSQDRAHLLECVKIGEVEGKDMSAVKEILSRSGAAKQGRKLSLDKLI